MGLPLNGTMQTAKSIPTCQDTCQKRCRDSSMRHQKKSRIPCIDTLQSNMDPRHNLSQTRKSPPPSTKKRRNIFKRWRAPSCTIRAVNPSILSALSAIGTKQATPTQTTMETIKQLLDYCATQEEAYIRYSARKMILCIHSDVGYCNEKNTRGRAGGHFFLSNNDQLPPNNGAIMTKRNNHKGGNVLGSRSRTGSIIFKWEGSSISPANTHQNGPSATTHPNPDQQHDCGRSNKQ